MMTSNRPLENWGKLVGDVPSATATHIVQTLETKHCNQLLALLTPNFQDFNEIQR